MHSLCYRSVSLRSLEWHLKQAKPPKLPARLPPRVDPQVMEKAEALSFFGEHSAEPWFQELCDSMAERGETTALCVSKSKGVASLQSLVGPADPKEVRGSACCARNTICCGVAMSCSCADPFPSNDDLLSGLSPLLCKKEKSGYINTKSLVNRGGFHYISVCRKTCWNTKLKHKVFQCSWRKRARRAGTTDHQNREHD